MSKKKYIAPQPPTIDVPPVEPNNETDAVIETLEDAPEDAPKDEDEHTAAEKETPSVSEKVEAEKETPSVSKDAQALFVRYPKLKAILQVGEQLFFEVDAGAAKDTANRTGNEIVRIENPLL